jgi:hypothetical protein
MNRRAAHGGRNERECSTRSDHMAVATYPPKPFSRPDRLGWDTCVRQEGLGEFGIA